METAQTQINSSGGNVNEMKLADGIYFTDYRRAAPVNNCQNSFMQKKNSNEIPKHPELILALFKENDNKSSKLIYSITELKAMENYQEDPEFVLAIKEDYEVLLRVLDYEVRLLEELERLDRYNPLLKKHNVQSLKEKITQYTQESFDFEEVLKAIEAKNNPIVEEKIVEVPNAETDANSVYI